MEKFCLSSLLISLSTLAISAKTMGAFPKIMSSPGDIKDLLKAVVE